MNFFETSELGLIAGLITLGYTPLERRKEGKRVVFMFEQDDEIERLKEAYYNNRLDVDAYKYATTLRSVKTSIYQMKD